VNVVAPGGGELIGDTADRRVEILCEHDALHVTWSRFAPGRDGAGLHIHRHHTDFFYVLAGELTVRLADGTRVVPAGRLVRVPPYVVHGFRNDGEAELRYLNLHVPGTGFADYMRGLRDGRRVAFDQEDPPAEGTRPAPEVVVEPEAVEEIAIAHVGGTVTGPGWLYDSDGAWIELAEDEEHVGAGLYISPRAPSRA
jgi:mannose-6-phosphate isomerase-like protein (cupin superfamily)